MPEGEDPFFPSHDERSRYAIDSAKRYGPRTGVDTYMTSQAGPSMASLIAPHRARSGHFEHEIDDGHREDDEAHLTANMSHSGTGENSPDSYSSGDPELDGGATPRTRRRTVRYSVTPSPLKRTGTAMKSVSKNLRRMSLRVVNLANTGLEGQLRLGDGEDTAKSKKSALDDDDDDDGPPAPDLKQVLPIRGRTLGFLGPESRIRLTLFRFLVHPLTEPIILIFIILNAVILTIQAFPSLTLPTANGRIKGYFHSLEDYGLFVLYEAHLVIMYIYESIILLCATSLRLRSA
ncbi:hypothetical protein B0H34DRAFT_861981 [Crassisporium funariophilum]|nr:hypothetical protein B0H34DRAFT_861981 [Crassisporium funariophilum]